jgi:hypothetical protein
MWVAHAKQCEALARAARITHDLGGEAAACELYRQAAYWALCALNRASLGVEAPREYAASLWNTLDERLLSGVADSAERREAFRAGLAGASFVHYAELPVAEQTSVCKQLRDLMLALLQRLASERRDYDRVRRQRVLRVGAVLLIALLAVGGVLRRRWASGDLAEGTLWRASSMYSGGGGCASPSQTCRAAEGGWFFHTEENDHNPWIEFELDSLPQDISMVEVENRTDCCTDRAVPLVIEVSLDHSNWQQVAERTNPFSTWRAKFPSVKASWVRLRVLRKGPFHLRRVRIFK